jgi:dihydropteroate synthase
MSPIQPEMVWSIGKRTLDTSSRTLIMGILNVTLDSFFDGGKYIEIGKAVEHGLRLQDEGADILDIGGESTRPGSESVSEEYELERVLPVIERLATQLNIPISIDTYKSAVAKAALAAGAEIVNDISGCRFDAEMPALVAESGAGLVLMHIKGEPKNMQVNPVYENMMQEIVDYLKTSIQIATAAGVNMNQIVVDPGIGFGKKVNHNLQILNELRMLEQLARPILVGPSRKWFIGKLLDLPTDDRLEGTLAAVTVAILNGARIVRVHDVRAIKRAAVIADAITGYRDITD